VQSGVKADNKSQEKQKEEEKKIDLQLVLHEHESAPPNSAKEQFIFWFTFNVVTNGPRINFLSPLLHPIFGKRNWWDEVVPGLLLGAIPIVEYGHENLLEYCQHKKRPLKRIVSCCSHSELKGEGLGVSPVPPQFWADKEIKQDHLAMADFTGMIPSDHSGVLTPKAQELLCLEKIHQSILNMHDDLQTGGSVYVHCKAGRGRSVLVVICYLIFFHGMTPYKATEFTRSKRPEISLSSVQIDFISKYYQQYRPVLLTANCDTSMALIPYHKEAKKSSWFDLVMQCYYWITGRNTLEMNVKTLQGYLNQPSNIPELIRQLSTPQAQALHAGLTGQELNGSTSLLAYYQAAQHAKEEENSNSQTIIDALVENFGELDINQASSSSDSKKYK